MERQQEQEDDPIIISNQEDQSISNNKEEEKIHTLEKIRPKMEDAHKKIGDLKRSKAVLLLGTTESGKSTILSAWNHGKLYAKKNDRNGIDLNIPDHLRFQEPTTLIGQHPARSETKIANWVNFEDLGITIFDCAGFLDSKVIQEVVNSYSLRKIFSLCEETSIFLVFSENDFQSTRNFITKKVLSDFSKMFKNGVSALTNTKSLNLIVNKAREMITPEIIGKYLQKIMETFSEDNEGKNYFDVLKYFLDNPDRIYSFPAAEKEGEFDLGIPLKTLVQQIGFYKPDIDNIEYSLSNEAKALIKQLLSDYLIKFEGQINQDSMKLAQLFEGESHKALSRVAECFEYRRYNLSNEFKELLDLNQRVLDYESLLGIIEQYSKLRDSYEKIVIMLQVHDNTHPLHVWLRQLKASAKVIKEIISPYQVEHFESFEERWVKFAEMLDFFLCLNKFEPEMTAKFLTILNEFKETFECILNKKHEELFNSIVLNNEQKNFGNLHNERQLYNIILGFKLPKISNDVFRKNFMDVKCLFNLTVVHLLLSQKIKREGDSRGGDQLFVKLITPDDNWKEEYDRHLNITGDTFLKCNRAIVEFFNKLPEKDPLAKVLVDISEKLFIIINKFFSEHQYLINRMLCGKEEEDLVDALFEENNKDFINNKLKTLLEKVEQFFLPEDDRGKSLYETLADLDNLRIVMDSFSNIMSLETLDKKMNLNEFIRSLEAVLNTINLEDKETWQQAVKYQYELVLIAQGRYSLDNLRENTYFDQKALDYLMIKIISRLDLSFTEKEQDKSTWYRNTYDDLRKLLKFFDLPALEQCVDKLKTFSKEQFLLEELRENILSISKVKALAHYWIAQFQYKIRKDYREALLSYVESIILKSLLQEHHIDSKLLEIKLLEKAYSKVTELYFESEPALSIINELHPNETRQEEEEEEEEEHKQSEVEEEEIYQDREPLEEPEIFNETPIDPNGFHSFWLRKVPNEIKIHIYRLELKNMKKAIDMLLVIVRDFFRGSNENDHQQQNVGHTHPLNEGRRRKFFRNTHGDDPLSEISFMDAASSVVELIDRISFYRINKRNRNRFLTVIPNILSILAKTADIEKILFTEEIANIPVVKKIRGQTSSIYLNFLVPQYIFLNWLCQNLINSGSFVQELLDNVFYGFNSFDFKEELLRCVANIKVKVFSEEPEYYPKLQRIFETNLNLCQSSLEGEEDSEGYKNIRMMINNEFLITYLKQKIIDCHIYSTDNLPENQSKIDNLQKALVLDTDLMNICEDQNLLALYRSISGKLVINTKLAKLFFEQRNFWEAILHYKKVRDIENMEKTFNVYLLSEEVGYKRKLEFAGLYLEMGYFESCKKVFDRTFKESTPRPLPTEIEEEFLSFKKEIRRMERESDYELKLYD